MNSSKSVTLAPYQEGELSDDLLFEEEYCVESRRGAFRKHVGKFRRSVRGTGREITFYYNVWRPVAKPRCSKRKRSKNRLPSKGLRWDLTKILIV